MSVQRSGESLAVLSIPGPGTSDAAAQLTSEESAAHQKSASRPVDAPRGQLHGLRD
jgi:hypothetical protein